MRILLLELPGIFFDKDTRKNPARKKIFATGHPSGIFISTDNSPQPVANLETAKICV